VETVLIGTARSLRHVFDQRFDQIGLNLSQATLLTYVDQYGSSSQSELAAMVGLGRAATGTMVDQLEAQGLVVREPDPSDRRVWLIAITPEGVATVRRVEAIDAELRDQLRAGITRAERQQLADLLSRLGDNIECALATEADPTEPPAAAAHSAATRAKSQNDTNSNHNDPTPGAQHA